MVITFFLNGGGGGLDLLKRMRSYFFFSISSISLQNI